MKKICIYIIVSVLLVTIAIFLIDYHVKSTTDKQLYHTTASVPYHKVGLLLGTSKYVVGGQINLYYKYRIEAAAKLYHANKISYILVSGDNGTKSYDEPTKMKADLMKAGIPENRIVLDYAGFRTLDSVIRADEVFQTTNYITISQRFHNERALYLANHFNHKAIGFNAKGVSYKYGFKVKIREYLARVKMILDLALGVKPKFLGKKISIGT